ncbi:MAG: DUF2846 domain-containing protein [Nitrospirae bacterium]|nr:DUF2846 domain-containing protein [Nitrospirota bacterium]
MTKIITKLLTISLLLAGMLVLSNCASLGPVYQKVEMVPDNVGLVYIYRPSGFVGGGVSYDIKVGETPITTLYSGGYYPYFSNPGEVEFWAQTESKSSVTLDIKAGQTYYIKGTVGVGIFVGRPHLMVMSPETAEKEIVECKLIPEEKK